MRGELDIYTGNANPILAAAIARSLGRDLARAEVFAFANENIFVRILENARERDVFLVQPMSRPVNDSIMELLIMIDAFKRASAGRITAVIPYYGYGRSDKKDQPRVPITARLVADLLETAGVSRILTMDLHQGQIQGFFDVPVDELSAVGLLADSLAEDGTDDLTVVTDLGFARRARVLAERLGAPLAIVEKRRDRGDNSAQVLNVIGEVRDRRVLIVDDEIDTAGTLLEIARAVEAAGAREIRACATHGVFSGDALERIEASSIREVHVTDSIPLPPGAASGKLRRVSVAPLFAAAIERIHAGESVGALFDR
jgi:ribose-phosphate pyrophosphokinase